MHLCQHLLKLPSRMFLLLASSFRYVCLSYSSCSLHKTITDRKLSELIIFFVQAGAFDLVGAIIYEIDGKPYQSTFYNGTIEVVEDGPLFRMESVFLSGLLISVIVFLIIYIQNSLRHMTKVHETSPYTPYFVILSHFYMILCHFLLGNTNFENG